MGKIAFVFPGQGAQYIGMGKDFYDNVPASKEIFEEAGNVTGLDIPKLIFEENEDINKTEFTQIAMVATEIAIFKAVIGSGVDFDFSAGHSLGEYAAIIATGAGDIKDVFSLVRKRGIYMQEAYPTGGAMSAVLGGDEAMIEKVCEETEGIVSIANYNCPGQIVITGEKAAVDAAGERLTKEGVKRVVPLKVSGPFHSALMKDAGEKLKADLEKVSFKDPVCPYIANYTADKVEKASEIPGLLVNQLSGSVRWTETVELLIKEGVDTVVELGPGHTLAGFNKRISRDIVSVNIEKYENLEEAVKTIKAAR
ncbi:MAG: ACP S-malonyltransferase [Lachnospiraceae bacterium]|nr:ACP S-malonyltransferase [Lachnospiraceae bacterium]